MMNYTKCYWSILLHLSSVDYISVALSDVVFRLQKRFLGGWVGTKRQQFLYKVFSHKVENIKFAIKQSAKQTNTQSKTI